MRRLTWILGLAVLLVLPAAALAGNGTSGDGTLVVQHGVGTGTGPGDLPVVQLTITGSVIGTVGTGKLVIDAGANPDPTAVPLVTGAGLPSSSPRSDTAQVWRSIPGNGPFKFRAVGGTYTVLVYGNNVNLVAVGTGTVRLAGLPDTPTGDGKYSLNGADFVSLPGTQTDKRTIGTTN